MNLNNLSAKELQDLENYIYQNITKKDIAIETLFQDLKKGNLKNKNVDTDALDFIYEGLTELFEKWNEQYMEQQPANFENPKDIKALFRRTLTFSQNKSSHELQNRVTEILKQNEYPKRSENLFFKNTIMPNSKFVKDDFIYLLRGAEAGQLSGFFSYPYCKNKMNLETYCKLQKLSPDHLLEKHSIDGKGYFISATTKLPFTTHFANEVKTENGLQNGSIYIIKINKRHAFRRVPYLSQFDNPLAPLVKLEDLDEDEYFIPDYIMPNELLKEFEYTDYIGVFKYLTETIGLPITTQDLGIQGDIEKVTKEYIKSGDFVRKTEAKISEAWKNKNYEEVFYTTLQELSKKFEESERN